jgi:hypothetical protein
MGVSDIEVGDSWKYRPIERILAYEYFRRSRDRKGAVELASRPVIYPITFACYGRHLHGSESGSVDREQNVPGTPILDVDSARARPRGNVWIRPPITWTRCGAMRNWKRFRRCVGIVAGVDP